MDAELGSYLDPRVLRLGYLGEWFRCAGNAPKVLMKFMEFTEALKDAVATNISEVVVLTVASTLKNAYERNQHERLALRTGFSREWIAEVERLAPDSALTMSNAERCAQRFTIAALRGDTVMTQRHFAALSEHFSPAQGIAIVMLIGRYWTHALGVNTLGLAAPVPSIFEDGFTV
jgi:alkylhydroperoxidase family enzyme